MWRLILACIICLCPTKRTLVLHVLNTFVVYVTHISCIVFFIELDKDWI